MVQVAWSRRALQDLKDIHTFIHKDSPSAAKRVVNGLTRSCLVLSRFTKYGKKLPEFPESDYRQIRWGAYRIFYRYEILSKQILINTIVHERRKARKL